MKFIRKILRSRSRDKRYNNYKVLCLLENWREKVLNQAGGEEEEDVVLYGRVYRIKGTDKSWRARISTRANKREANSELERQAEREREGL